MRLMMFKRMRLFGLTVAGHTWSAPSIQTPSSYSFSRPIGPRSAGLNRRWG